MPDKVCDYYYNLDVKAYDYWYDYTGGYYREEINNWEVSGLRIDSYN